MLYCVASTKRAMCTSMTSCLHSEPPPHVPCKAIRTTRARHLSARAAHCHRATRCPPSHLNITRTWKDSHSSGRPVTTHWIRRRKRRQPASHHSTGNYIHSSSRRQLRQLLGKHDHRLPKPICDNNEGMGRYI